MSLSSTSLPEYFFGITLFGMKAESINLPVRLISNSHLGSLVTPPAGRFTIATGDTEALSFGRTLSPNPAYYQDIPAGVISSNTLLSRQLIGTSIEIDITYIGGTMIAPDIINRQVILRGVIGNITQSPTRVRIEYLSDVDRIKTPDRYRVSVNCMNTLGTGKCTLSRQSLLLDVYNVLNGKTFMTNHAGIFEANSQYEVVIGSTPYLVNKNLSGSGNLTIYGSILGIPQMLTLRRHCNQSIKQCELYSNVGQFNGNILITTSQISAIT